ncbi:MAG: hypothetical protein V7K89_25340 [Nostoc sp.]|uniref:hypothetical protein n=1 Tax=Nostoc sp. TaxID=1180 RepID=UPI002FF972DC
MEIDEGLGQLNLDQLPPEEALKLLIKEAIAYEAANLKLRTPNSEFKTLNSKKRTSNFELRTPNSEFKTSNFEFGTLNFEKRTPNFEFRFVPLWQLPFISCSI